MQLRELLPWRDFVIDTSWSPGVVGAELKKRILPSRLFDFIGDSEFVGKSTSATDFHFRRRISYRNSFIPSIVVRIEPSHRDGARIHVTMRLYALVAVLSVLMISMTSIGAVGAVVAFLSSGDPSGLAVLGVPVFGVALCSIPFAIEARIAERMLRGIFAAAPGTPPPYDTGIAYR